MKSATVRQLLEINRRFYQEHGHEFADTRTRIQPGVRRVLHQSIQANDVVLDFGCGNGAFAASLSDHGHRGAYTGLDFSLPMIERARQRQYNFPARFRLVELTGQDLPTAWLFGTPDGADGDPASFRAASRRVVTAFAFLHHIPGREMRLQIMKQIHSNLREGECLILSNWQFTANPRMRSRLLPWASTVVHAEDVDPGDHLVEWRGGSVGTRYVHEFTEAELTELATSVGFRITSTLASDGADHRSALYMTLQRA